MGASSLCPSHVLWIVGGRRGHRGPGACSRLIRPVPVLARTCRALRGTGSVSSTNLTIRKVPEWHVGVVHSATEVAVRAVLAVHVSLGAAVQRRPRSRGGREGREGRGGEKGKRREGEERGREWGGREGRKGGGRRGREEGWGEGRCLEIKIFCDDAEGEPDTFQRRPISRTSNLERRVVNAFGQKPTFPPFYTVLETEVRDDDRVLHKDLRTMHSAANTGESV